MAKAKAMPKGLRIEGQSMSRKRLMPRMPNSAQSRLWRLAAVSHAGRRRRTAKGMAMAALTVTTINGATANGSVK
ncbi:hypothetical protein D3C80_2149570 [compost metagenome]